MRGAVIVWAVALLASACSGAARTPATTVADKDARKDTAKQARGLIQDAYSAIRHGHGANAQTLLADRAFVVGPAAGDLFGGRSDTVVAVTSRFEITDRHRVRSRGLVAVSSPTGHSAWAADRVDIDRARLTLVAVLAQVDDIWYAVAVQLGREPGGAGAETLPPLGGRVDGGAAEVVDLVREGAAEPAKFLDQLAEADTLIIGPGKRDQTRGKRGIKRLWKKRKLADHPIEIDGEPRAGATPDGALVWVVANSRTGEASPQRILWLYQRAEDGWRLVLMQWTTPSA
jgi:hypothetical protein